MAQIKINNELIDESGGIYDCGVLLREHQDMAAYATIDRFIVVYGDDEWASISASADPNKFYFITETT